MTYIHAPNGSSLASFALSSAVSPAVTDLVDRVRPSVVQVRSMRGGAGTGVIWRADGAIITNDHVVAHAQGALSVVLTDGRSFEARLLARNPRLDLALITINASDLPAATVGDSRALRLGELVLAIGHPWGQPWVVTAGIVSALGEVPVGNNGQTATYIRSDVRLAPGNSGGPLLDARGHVIGINAMIFGGDLSVAIPSHVASEWLSVQPQEPRQRPALGVRVQAAVLPDTQANLAGRTAGLLVVGVDAGSAAERAGVLLGDLLVDASGRALDTPAALRDILEGDAGAPLRLSVVRGDMVHSLEVAWGSAADSHSRKA
jgi:serine protease Do